jgi:hypothetical protein
VNTTVQVGGALGMAVLATISASRTAHLARGLTAAPCRAHRRPRVAFGAGAVLVVLALVVAGATLAPERRRRVGHGVVEANGAEA